MKITMLTSDGLYRLLDMVNWGKEIELIKDYIAVSRLNNLSEFAYIALGYLENNIAEGLRGYSLENYMSVKFENRHLKYLSDYFLDEIVILVETSHQSPYRYIEIDSFYDHLIEFCSLLADRLFINTSNVKQTAIVSCREGALICKII